MAHVIYLLLNIIELKKKTLPDLEIEEKILGTRLWIISSQAPYPLSRYISMGLIG